MTSKSSQPSEPNSPAKSNAESNASFSSARPELEPLLNVDAGPDQIHRVQQGTDSIESFLTDGKLVRLCDELGELIGAQVELRDSSDQRIVTNPNYDPNDPDAKGWSICEQTRADAEPTGDAVTRHPLLVEGDAIGWMVVDRSDSSAPSRPHARNDAGERVVALVAAAAAELCSDVVELRDRVDELTALHRLSSLLSAASSVDRILTISLSSAIQVLGMDSGSMVLLPEDDVDINRPTESDLQLKASMGLSDAWLSSPKPLSKERVFDRLVLGGEVVVSDDLLTDERVSEPERLRDEAVRSFLSAGLIFRQRPVGIIRLYSHKPRVFSDFEQRMIASIGQLCAAAVEHARWSLAKEKQGRIRRQLELAADIQRRMLPRETPQIRGVDLAARYIPSDSVGGDFYDWFELGGSLGMTVGDVVGKGIGASLLMSAVRATLRAHAQDLYDLGEVLSRVNRALCRDTLESEFTTLWYGVLNPDTLRLTYCSAGHDPTFIVRVPEHRAPTMADLDELAVGGLVLGLDPSQRYQLSVYDMHPGDVLVAYSDGVPDVRDFSGRRFGRPRLHRAVIDALKQDPHASAEAIAQHVLWEVRRFGGLSMRHDDQTLLVLSLTRDADRG
jgi:sigma-B regulation protein RsbU (phosphoserine phosphatase)